MNFFSRLKNNFSQLFIPTILVFSLIVTTEVVFLGQNLKNTADYYSQFISITSIGIFLSAFVLTYYNLQLALKGKKWFPFGLNVILGCIQFWMAFAAVDWLTRDSYPQQSFAFILIATLGLLAQILIAQLQDQFRLVLIANVFYLICLALLFQKVFNADVRFLQIISATALGFELLMFFRLLRVYLKQYSLNI
jgi:hypothetical protein